MALKICFDSLLSADFVFLLYCYLGSIAGDLSMVVVMAVVIEYTGYVLRIYYLVYLAVLKVDRDSLKP